MSGESKFKQPEPWLWDGWESIPTHLRKAHVAAIQANTMAEAARIAEGWYGVCGASEKMRKAAAEMARGEYKPEQ